MGVEMRVRRRLSASLAVLILTAGSLAGCSPLVRGALGVTVDQAGRIIGVIALCGGDRLLSLTIGTYVPGRGGAWVELRPASGENPDQVVVSAADPGPDWSATVPHPGASSGPGEPVNVGDPRDPSLDDQEHVLRGSRPSRIFDTMGITSDVRYVPRDLARNEGLRDGWVLDSHGQAVSPSDFEESKEC